MIGAVVPQYECASIGTPFRVLLVDSVLSSGEDVSIPDMGGMLAEVAMIRLGEARRLTGGDLRFLRRVGGLNHGIVAGVAGISTDEYAIYERDERPMPPSMEKLLRIALFHKARRSAPRENDAERMIAHMDWVFDTWRAAPVVAGRQQPMRLRHTRTRGWHQAD